MKKLNIFLFMLMALALQSCLHDDKDSFSDSAAERMQKRLIENEATLRTAPNGWLMKYYPNQNKIYGGYTLLVKFNEANKVEIMSERGGHTKVVESLYSMVSDSGPVLRFDTHNELLHYFAEPKNPDGIGPADSGMQGDYEFVIIEATAEKITMKGKKTGNTIVMLPIPAEKDWEQGMELLVKNSKKLSQNSKFKMEVDGVESENAVQHKYRTLNIAGEVYPYIVTETGIDMTEPLIINGKKIHSFKLVEGDGDVVLINEEANVKLLTMFPTLSESLFGDYFSFTYSLTEQYSRALFDALRDQIFTPKNVQLVAVALGPPGENYAISMFTIIDGKLVRDTYFLDVLTIDEKTVKIVFSGYIAGDTANAHYSEFGYKLLVKMVEGTFKLTSTDAPSSINKIRMENIADPTRSFTVSRGLIEDIYEK